MGRRVGKRKLIVEWRYECEGRIRHFPAGDTFYLLGNAACLGAEPVPVMVWRTATLEFNRGS
jgi:hypothetical protein